MIRWLLYLPLNIVMGISVLFLAPLAVALFSTPDKLHLVRLRWLETLDNDLSGDDGWKSEHLIGKDPLTWLNRTRWLWRNGGNTVNYQILGCKDDPEWREKQDRTLGYWKRPDGYWLFRKPLKLTDKYFIDRFFGWNILGSQQGMCKFVFTIRVKTKW